LAAAGGAVRTCARELKYAPDRAASAARPDSLVSPARTPRPSRRRLDSAHPNRRGLRPPSPRPSPRRRPRAGEPPCFLGRLPCADGAPPRRALRGPAELGHAHYAGRGQVGHASAVSTGRTHVAAGRAHAVQLGRARFRLDFIFFEYIQFLAN
jgi:hypothetical protein